MRNISNRLKELRKTRGLSQQQVAKGMGIPQQTYQKLEAGHTKNSKALLRVANYFNTTPEYLLFGSEEKIKAVQWVALLSWDEVPLPSDLAIIRDKEGTIAMADIGSLEAQDLYALPVEGNAMTSSVPGKMSFFEHQLIIIDPHKQPKSGDFVIAKQDGAEKPIFRQYMVEGNAIYLIALNSLYPIITLDNSIIICGVVIKAQHCFY